MSAENQSSDVLEDFFGGGVEDDGAVGVVDGVSLDEGGADADLLLPLSGEGGTDEQTSLSVGEGANQKTYEQICEDIRKLQEQAEAVRAAEIEAAISQIKTTMKAKGISLSMIAKALRMSPAAKTSSPAKYRNPATGQTWSGRGRVPHWFKRENEQDFLISTKEQ